MIGLHDSCCAQMCILCLKNLDQRSISLSDLPLLYEIMEGSFDLSQQRLRNDANVEF